jgi:hypothetical protein
MFGKNVYVLELSYFRLHYFHGNVYPNTTRPTLPVGPIRMSSAPPPPYYVSVSVMIGGNLDIL